MASHCAVCGVRPYSFQSPERANIYNYLGITHDDKLSRKCHVDAVVKKVHSMFYCLRKFRCFDVHEYILQTFHAATISSVLTFGMTCWGGNASKQGKNRLDKNTKKAGGVFLRKKKA